MNTIWYEPLIHALRIHIEQKHMNEEGALLELQMTEEYLSYGEFGDDEKIKIGCPWSDHCNCSWEVQAHTILKLNPKTLRLKQ
ncbi:MAG: hypothetical protein ACTSRW_16970 [Candidatus Helarchaeota archaeon]